MCLELGEGILDRIEIGTVGRQIAEFRPAGFDSLPDAGDLVGGQIVHDDDVAWPQVGDQHLLAPGQEASPSIGPSSSIGATKPARSDRRRR